MQIRCFLAYLNHQAEVEAYLQQRQQQSQEIRAMNQARFDPQGLRDIGCLPSEFSLRRATPTLKFTCE